jgi:hypothetical protein
MVWASQSKDNFSTGVSITICMSDMPYYQDEGHSGRCCILAAKLCFVYSFLHDDPSFA